MMIVKIWLLAFVLSLCFLTVAFILLGWFFAALDHLTRREFILIFSAAAASLCAVLFRKKN